MMRARNSSEMRLAQKICQVNWTLVLLITVVASIGFAMLYSAANGSITPWALKQMVVFGAGLVMMLVIAVIDIRLWLRYAYVFYALAIGLLLCVEFVGVDGSADVDRYHEIQLGAAQARVDGRIAAPA